MKWTGIPHVRGALATVVSIAGDPRMVGVEKLSEKERDFLTITLCMELVKQMLLETTQGDRSKAIEGLDILVNDLRKNLADA